MEESNKIKIKELWRNHSLFEQGVVELVPTEWVWKYWGRDVSPTTGLMDGTRVSVEELWDNIIEVGLHDPLVMRVGLQNQKFRLESGNHRIQAFYKHGITELPLTVQVRDECGPHLGDVMTDASHNFEAGDEFLISTITKEYMLPSEVFRSLR